MADLSRLQLNDTLKIPVRVISVDHSPIPVQVQYGMIEFWLDPNDLEAAEHIPAPRVFKRGDWVKLPGFGGISHGLVIKVKEGTAALGALVTVSWPDGCSYDYYPGNLDPDEAPE